MNFGLKRNLSLLSAVFESGLYSGVIIGWSSMAFILKTEGNFRSLPVLISGLGIRVIIMPVTLV